MGTERPKSTIGRLLEELSWVGKNIKNYRDGGRGYENVLTAEALQALDFLPRRYFLVEVIKAAHGADTSRAKIIKEIEEARMTLLPGNFYLNESANSYQEALPIQPDGIIETSNCYVIVEAKRIRSSSFQTEQLAREFVLLMREAGNKTPILLLLLGSPPPVNVDGHGKISIHKSINLYLEKVLNLANDDKLHADNLITRVKDVVSWITWQEIKEVVSKRASRFSTKDPSIEASVKRLANTVIKAVNWHA